MQDFKSPVAQVIGLLVLATVPRGSNGEVKSLGKTRVVGMSGGPFNHDSRQKPRRGVQRINLLEILGRALPLLTRNEDQRGAAGKSKRRRR